MPDPVDGPQHLASLSPVSPSRDADGARIGPLMMTEAVLNFWPADDRCLRFEVKDMIAWYPERPAPTGWGYGTIGSEMGFFPLAYVELVEMIPIKQGSSHSRKMLRRTSIAFTPPAEASAGTISPVCCSTEGTVRQRLYAFFEYPETSTLATYWAVFVMALIGLSVVAVVAQTMTTLQDQEGHALHPEIWDGFEFTITIVFSFEYVARLILVEGSRCNHVLSPLNLIDAAAISPYYVQLASEAAGAGDSNEQAWMRVLRVARVFRVLKLSKYSDGLQTFGTALTQAAPALVVQACLMFVFMMVCSTLFFFVEQGEWDAEQRVWLRTDGHASPFDSIPKTWWWAFVTMTTVGYGDVFPVSVEGKMIGVFTMLVGVLCIALPVSVVTTNFQEQYYEKRLMTQTTTSDSKGGKHSAKPSDEFRAQYMALRQVVAQMQVVLEALQRCASSVEAKLEPKLHQRRTDRIMANRLVTDLGVSLATQQLRKSAADVTDAGDSPQNHAVAQQCDSASCGIQTATPKMPGKHRPLPGAPGPNPTLRSHSIDRLKSRYGDASRPTPTSTAIPHIGSGSTLELW